jgi:hypothetical protein
MNELAAFLAAIGVGGLGVSTLLFILLVLL